MDKISGIAVQLATAISTGNLIAGSVMATAKALASLFGGMSDAELDQVLANDLVVIAQERAVAAAQAKGQ
jgi:hypothetical protein